MAQDYETTTGIKVQPHQEIIGGTLTHDPNFSDPENGIFTSQVGETKQYCTPLPTLIIVDKNHIKRQPYHPDTAEEIREAHHRSVATAKAYQEKKAAENSEKNTRNSTITPKNNNIESNSTESGE